MIETGSIKDSTITSPIVLPTEWNHIEASLAYSKSLPIMVLHHKGVSRGVFDRGVMNAFIHEVEFSKRSWCMEASLNGAFQKWKSNCESGSPNFLGKAKVDPSKPQCPIAALHLNLYILVRFLNPFVLESGHAQNANISSNDC